AVVRATPETLVARAGTAFWMVLTLGLLFYAIIYLSAGAVARFYHLPEAASVLRVIGVSILLYSMSRVPSAVLEREMRYARKAIPEVVASFVYAGSAVGLAFLQLGYWSIVGATVIRSAVLSGGLFAVTQAPPSMRIFRWAARDLFRSAGVLSAASTVRLAYTNADNAFVGRVSGVTALGYYAMAYNLGNLLAIQVAGALGAVLFPAYVRMMPDLARVRAATFRLLRSVSLLVVPFTVVGAFATPRLVPLVLGPRWSPATLALQILLVYGCFHSLGPIYWALLQAGDRNHTNLKINCLSLAIALLAAWPVATRFGINGVAVEFTLLEGLRFALLATAVRRHFGLTWEEQVRAVLPAVSGGGLVIVILLALTLLWPAQGFAAMVLEILAGGAVYLAHLLRMGTIRLPRRPGDWRSMVQ
ncbi:MAG: oligosaccharide flippase family protein, partial [Candidatus Dormibacteraeota bacterium]|nr:oligosaccharide flippase family protein [Candidatus Dormibacteraeota bacterium]